jgi:acetyl esterase/lipase
MTFINRSIALFWLTSFSTCSWATSALTEPVSFTDVTNLKVKAPFAQVSYGSAPEQTLTRFRQSNGGEGTILLFHGGCWSNAYGVDHALPMAQALAQLGYDVWAAEYRRVGDAGGGWPGTLTDVKRAIDYVSQNTGIAPLIIGHSAGGHLALKASEDPNLNIRAVIALAPIIDLVTYGKEKGSCQSMVAKLMGDDAYRPDTRYQEASVARSRLRVPVKIIIGSEDPIVSFEQVAPFAPSYVSIAAGAGHFDLIHPQTNAFSLITSTVEVLSSNARGSDR